jgi:hypothetical protein
MLVAWRSERHGARAVVAAAPLAGLPPDRFAALYPEPRCRSPRIDDRRADLADHAGLAERADPAERADLVDQVAS